MCRVLDVARSAFYAWQRRGPSMRARRMRCSRWRSRSIIVRPPRIRQSADPARPARRAAPREQATHRPPHARTRTGRHAGTALPVTTQTDAALPVAPNHLARQFTVVHPESRVGRRHYVLLDRRGLALSRRRARSLLAESRRLGHERASRPESGTSRIGSGARDPAADGGLAHHSGPR